ncbi:MAG: NHL repeat-containing protein [Phycisphaerae bacterium]|nr:NHL repeat-containing protein [Phycisphaerae bacterium]
MKRNPSGLNRCHGVTLTWLLLTCVAHRATAVMPQAISDHWANGTCVVRRTVITGSADSPFNMPTDCAVAADGRLYVLDGVNNRVVVCAPDGTIQFQFGSQGSGLGQLQFPLGITVSQAGEVYVADAGNGRFQIFSSAGQALEAVPIPKATSGSRSDPSDLVVDQNLHRLYVVDNDNHKLHLYNLQSKTFETVWGSQGQGRRQFRYPFLIDISDKGYLFVVEPINTRVQVLNPQGKFVNFVGHWGVKAGQLFRPKGVAVVGHRVYVTDSYLGRIQMFDVTGEFLGVLSDRAGAPIALTTPTGIAADIPNKHLYVVELKANQVCRLDVE